MTTSWTTLVDDESMNVMRTSVGGLSTEAREFLSEFEAALARMSPERQQMVVATVRACVDPDKAMSTMAQLMEHFG